MTSMPTDFLPVQPLMLFYEAAGLALPECVEVSAEQVPEPQKSLLVHRRDMTTTLERFHGSLCGVEVLERSDDGATYSRLVVLKLENGKPIEFGAITIFLSAFSAHAQDEIRHERRPLGSILHSEKVDHYARPQAFIEVRADDLIRRSLEIEGSPPLYGRCNQLFNGSDVLLAEIVEILPPAD